MSDTDCLLCTGDEADQQFGRTLVWQDDLWRLSMRQAGYTTGFSFLEPKRHIPHITNLDGDEAASFGPVLAKVTSALKAAADAELVYVYIFGGGIAHLHVHLAPHRQDDALNANIIRGELDVEPHPSGASRLVSREFAELPADQIRAVIDRARALLS